MEKKIIGYELVSEIQPSFLNARIKILIDRGWEPEGPLTILRGHDHDKYNQVMILQENK